MKICRRCSENPSGMIPAFLSPDVYRSFAHVPMFSSVILGELLETFRFKDDRDLTKAGDKKETLRNSTQVQRRAKRNFVALG